MKKTTLLSTVFAFDNTTGWKLDENGNVELKDGNPVYIDASGRELTLGTDTISRLNAEAKTHREGKEAAETKLKQYEGLDPEKAREALELTSKLDQKKLIDAGKVDELKQQITTQFQEKLGASDKTINELQQQINGMKVNDIFKSSEFVRDSIAVPQDMFEATFRNNFKIEEDGSVGAYDKSGNRLLSKSRAGEFAAPDEALQLLVESHPQKDVILRADNKKGSGGTGGGNRGGGRVVKRSDFEAMNPYQQSETAALARKGEITLTD